MLCYPTVLLRSTVGHTLAPAPGAGAESPDFPNQIEPRSGDRIKLERMAANLMRVISWLFSKILKPMTDD